MIHFFLLPSTNVLKWGLCKILLYGKELALYLKNILTLSQTKILDSSELKEFTDDSFSFDENGRKFSKWIVNIVGKGEIARHKQFVLSSQCFQKTCTADM